jgi:Kef-type K+ transport system membrane component KefB
MEHGFLRDVGVSIVSAGAIGLGTYLLRLPILLGYLAAGAALGPNFGMGVITSPETIYTLSEIGLILLMYILGMEIDLKKLLKAGRAVFINGVTQFLGCVLLGLFTFSLLGFKSADGDFSLIYIAIAASLSSTLIVVKILSDRVELDTFTSRITLGILVLQDIWAIAFLAAQPNLSHFNASIIFFSFSKAALLILIAGLTAKYFLPWLFERIAKNMELTLVIAMGWCFGFAGLAGMLGLSLEMGALVAGVSIASFPYHVQIAVKISSLRDFFVTLFFVGLGLQIPVPNKEILSLALVIIAFTSLSRIFTVFPVLHKLKFGNYGSLIPALNLGQVSEFSLVILSLGVTYGHIEKNILSSFILALVLTTLISSIVIPNSHKIYRWLNPLLEKIGFKDMINREKTEDTTEDEVQAKFVFLGFFREASSLLKEIEDRHSKSSLKEMLVVDFNPKTIKTLREKGIKVHYGDIGDSDTLNHLDLSHSKLIVSTIPDSILKGTSNLKLLKAVKRIVPTAVVIVTSETIETARQLYKEGADYVYIPRIVSAHYLTDIIERIESGNATVIKENATKFLQDRKEVIG